MIIGLTHEKDGITPVQRLAINSKVSIGLPADSTRNHPEKVDYFRILKKDGKGEWEEDKSFYQHLRETYMPEVMIDGVARRAALREFDIVFLSDDIEEVFPTTLAWWSASEKKCGGNGLDAQRSLTALSANDKAKFQLSPGQKYVPWKPCGDGCPEMDKGICKPNGTLYFIFKDRPTIGSIVKFDTTSYESIRRISSSLLQIQAITGGRLRGLPLKMVLRPGKTRFQDKEGKVKNSNAFFVNLEFRQDDYNKLVPRLMEQSVAYERTLIAARRPKLLTEAADSEIEVQAEEQLAKEMHGEFYSADEQQQNTRHDVAGEAVNDVIAESKKTFLATGLTNAHWDAIINSSPTGGIVDWVKKFLAILQKRNAEPGQQRVDIFNAALQRGLGVFDETPQTKSTDSSEPKGPRKRTAKKPESASESPAVQPAATAKAAESQTPATEDPQKIPTKYEF